MQRLLALTAAILTLSGPALARSQLERLLGVTPEIYSPSELAQLHFASADDDNPPIRFETKGTLILSTHGHREHSVAPGFTSRPGAPLNPED